MPLILGANSVSGGYNVANSLRFNSGSSDYLSRTPAGSSNRKTWTWSGWVKLLGTNMYLFGASSDSWAANYSTVWINASAQLRLELGGISGNIVSTNLFRDPSAWYHFVVAVDTTQATANNRVRMYVNGVETAYSDQTMPAQNSDTMINSAQYHQISGRPSTQYLNGYLAEINLIDGQQLTPSSFGETDQDTNIWIPKAYTGSFGTNGFYLQFKNSASLGTDSSGNGNTFTVNNLTSIDQTTDTPTNNFATMNPLTSFGTVTLAEGNLQVGVPDNTANSTSTFMVSSGKWYWEVKQTVGTLAMVGIRPEGMNYNQNSLFNLTGTNQGYYYYGDSGNIRPANTAYGNSFGVGDIIGVALDLDNNKLYFSKNGTFQNSGVPTSGATGTGAVSIATSGLTWGFSFTSGGNIDTIQCNFGNPPFTIASGNADANGYGNFEYAVPSGYYSLCTKNLADYG